VAVNLELGLGCCFEHASYTFTTTSVNNLMTWRGGIYCRISVVLINYQVNHR